jgi:nitronate monooxygenase
VFAVSTTVGATVAGQGGAAMNQAFARANGFCSRFGLRVPILMAPMAGACPASLSAAVANAGGLGACGVVVMQPGEIGA